MTDDQVVRAIALAGELWLSPETFDHMRAMIPPRFHTPAAIFAMSGIRLVKIPGMEFGVLATPSGVSVTMEWLFARPVVRES